MQKTITIEGVDIELLRKQRDYLLVKFKEGTNPLIDGLVNLLDEMLDVGEGYRWATYLTYIQGNHITCGKDTQCFSVGMNCHSPLVYFKPKVLNR